MAGGLKKKKKKKQPLLPTNVSQLSGTARIIRSTLKETVSPLLSGPDIWFKRGEHTIFTFDFTERVREGEIEGQKYRCEREIWIGCLPNAPRLGTKPATQACALTRNQTGDFWFAG